jgi:hypothetical protein
MGFFFCNSLYESLTFSSKEAILLRSIDLQPEKQKVSIMTATTVSLIPEWISQYNHRSWSKAIELLCESEDHKELSRILDSFHPTLPARQCHGDSAMAKEWWNRGFRDAFYVDEEQIMAGLEQPYGYCLGRLTQTWRNFPIDTLVMITFKGVTRNPSNYTIFCELP